MNRKDFLKAAVGVIAAPLVVKEVKVALDDVDAKSIAFVLPGSLDVPPLKFNIPKRTGPDQAEEDKIRRPVLGQMYYQIGEEEGFRFFSGLKWHKIVQPS